MQAIQSKVVPATNTKPTYIKAWCARGSVCFSITNLTIEVSDPKAHAMAAKALTAKFIKEDIAKYGTPSAGKSWAAPFVTGCLPNGDYCHVFTK